MNWKYEKNFTDQGYQMKYEKPGVHSYLKNHVFQFKIELDEISPKIWKDPGSFGI